MLLVVFPLAAANLLARHGQPQSFNNQKTVMTLLLPLHLVPHVSLRLPSVLLLLHHGK